jgi:hypothetical protein
MPATTLVRSVIATVQSQLQDNSPAYRRWPETEVIQALNYAHMALAKYLPQVSSRTDTIRMTSGSRQDLSLVQAANIKPGDGSTPVDTYGIAVQRVLCNMGSDGLTIGRAVRGPVDRYPKDCFAPTWTTDTGPVVLDIVFDKDQPLQFWLSPTPTTQPHWMRVQWMAQLPKLPDGGPPSAEVYTVAGAQNATTIKVPDSYAEDLANYVIAFLLLKGSKNTQNLAKAQTHAQMFVASINAQAKAVMGSSPNLKVLPFAAEAV